jgi:hypothetical protein
MIIAGGEQMNHLLQFSNIFVSSVAKQPRLGEAGLFAASGLPGETLALYLAAAVLGLVVLGVAVLALVAPWQGQDRQD